MCTAYNNMIVVTPLTDISGTCHNIQDAIDAVTGNGYVVQIEPGVYDESTTITVAGKSNIQITGNPQAGSGAAVINFNPGGGWGFLIQNSSGSFEYLTVQGGSSNGMFSIQNSSNFTVGYTKLNSTTSHTMDIQGSNNISVFNTEIQSSAGALEIQNSNYINVSNNKIFNSANAIAIYNASNISVIGNLIVANDESAITTQSLSNSGIFHNTIYNNGVRVVSPAVSFANPSGLIGFNDNIVGYTHGIGFHITGTNNATFNLAHNDFYTNEGGNFVGMADQTGSNGNIATDPLLSTSQNPATYCLLPGSPALYGSVVDSQYMGYIGPCSSATPIPTPQPTFGPTPSPSASPQPTPSPSPTSSIKVLYPNGGETLVRGQHYTIAWQGTGVQHYLIYLVNSLGQQSLIDGKDTPTTTLDWAVDSPLIASPSYKIRIVNSFDGSVLDESDDFFTIRTEPQVLSFLIKFAGVTNGSANGTGVKVYLQTPNGILETPPVTAVYQESGIYKLSFIPSTPLPNSQLGDSPSGPKQIVIRYPVFLKGEKHLKLRFCTVNLILTRCSGSVTPNEGLIIDPQGGTYDLTAYALEPGDLSPQDGVVNGADFNKIITLLLKPHSALTTQDLLVGDLNYDGYINTRDLFLIRQTLQTRYDEN